MKHDIEPRCGFERADATFSDESDYSHRRGTQVRHGDIFVGLQNRQNSTWRAGSGFPPNKMGCAAAAMVEAGVSEAEAIRLKTGPDIEERRWCEG